MYTEIQILGYYYSMELGASYLIHWLAKPLSVHHFARWEVKLRFGLGF